VRRHGFDSEYPEQFSTVDMWSTMGVLIVCTQCRHISTRMTTDSSTLAIGHILGIMYGQLVYYDPLSGRHSCSSFVLPEEGGYELIPGDHCSFPHDDE
jgi:hypothetical protein